MKGMRAERAAAAHAAAEAEGLVLVRADNSAGFKGVHTNSSASNPFQASMRRDGRNNHLGTFATAEEAALAGARALGPEGVAAALAADEAKAVEPAPMTAAEAHAAAASEGLALLRAENPRCSNATGFKGVYRIGSASKPFHAQLRHGPSTRQQADTIGRRLHERRLHAEILPLHELEVLRCEEARDGERRLLCRRETCPVIR